jgi:hypothetical protein
VRSVRPATSPPVATVGSQPSPPRSAPASSPARTARIRPGFRYKCSIFGCRALFSFREPPTAGASRALVRTGLLDRRLSTDLVPDQRRGAIADPGRGQVSAPCLVGSGSVRPIPPSDAARSWRAVSNRGLSANRPRQLPDLRPWRWLLTWHAPGLSPRCPRTAVNTQRSPSAATCEPEAGTRFKSASAAREHARNA